MKKCISIFLLLLAELTYGQTVLGLGFQWGVVAAWDVDVAQPYWTLQHMRDFATTPDGLYGLTFPDETNPTDFLIEVEQMKETSDAQVIGVQFVGNKKGMLITIPTIPN
ncbi:MAG: hypothetical protein ABJO02_08535 [Reichenbachiella sp.]|uniref:hypothetical protein n=1 Tax=Reichenbachiella sp. TaxID=2184521 RepID=UPI003297CFA6